MNHFQMTGFKMLHCLTWSNMCGWNHIFYLKVKEMTFHHWETYGSFYVLQENFHLITIILLKLRKKLRKVQHCIVSEGWDINIFMSLAEGGSEKTMATHSSTLAWKIPWTEEPGGLQSMWSRRLGHDWATSLSLFTFMHWRRKWQPTPVFLPGDPRDGGAWWAAIYGVAQGRTWRKWLSSA